MSRAVRLLSNTLALTAYTLPAGFGLFLACLGLPEQEQVFLLQGCKLKLTP